ncbi:MAG: PleD family two-component system response regulator [Cyanobacteriota bacterium]|jgi:CheY-like chemotaxis protein
MTKPTLSPGRSPLILVVDDDNALRSLLVLALRGDGYQIEEAVNGRDCLAKYQRLQPDLVLLDAMMPEMDGFEACQNLKTLAGDSPLPILMITFLDDRDSIEQAFACGATDYITKPIHWAVLKQRVRHLLAASHCFQRGTPNLQSDWESLLSSLLAALAQTPEITPELAPILRECLAALGADRLELYDAEGGLRLEISEANPAVAPKPTIWAIPLTARSRRLGVLNLHRRDAQAWEGSRQGRCQDLANLLALALLTESTVD